ncbi:nickel/cobalt transporter [Ectothiorhodospira haloalkaliphila]|uniref:nickel/cobalt transporter n=1 Tax=Ectothiorhodospira haloalkaliphila TaxID=421628 RepID=UPI001EE7ED16|nr:nickel/cobalt transporter [Ectothiorhodospira haloalkaliphila]MCG5523554.1 nickel/cobalt transporter [Ectothiorhodospira haloalkaliphila]
MFPLIILLIAALLIPGPASASPLTGGDPAQESTEQQEAPAEATGTDSLLDRFVAWTITQQRALHRQLADGMEALQDAPTAANAGALILISFLYGIFHAAGPGHGKAVITTYLLTHRQHMRRALTLSFAAALMQGLTAIIAVATVLFVIGRTARDAMGQAPALEQASFALVALLGAWLMLRALRQLIRIARERRRRRAPTLSPAAGAAPVFMAGPSQSGTPAPLAPSMNGPSMNGHAAHHEHGRHCGCAHHVDPSQAARADSVWAMLATVTAVGIRPCTGAILVLVVAHIMGLWTAGIAAVMAMSIGTAITVSILAIMAVQARALATRLSGGLGVKTQVAAHGVGLLGGMLILGMGLILLLGSFTTRVPHPMGL